MGTTVTAPSSDPVSVSEIKAHLRVDGDEENAYISGLVKAATEYAQTFTARQFINATVVHTLPHWPSGVIYLPRPKLQSVTSITYVDPDGDTQTLAADQYVAVTDSIVGYVERAYSATWPATRVQSNAVTVTYTAGYGASASSVPDSVRHAILLMVGHWFQNREAVSMDNLKDVPLAAEALLMTERVLELV